MSDQLPESILDRLYHESILGALGLLEPDQPTPGRHMLHQWTQRRRLTAPFTAVERQEIRLRFGMTEDVR